jgi:hypothetical protein
MLLPLPSPSSSDEIQFSGCKWQKFTMANLSKRKFPGKAPMNGGESVEPGRKARGTFGSKSDQQSVTAEVVWLV